MAKEIIESITGVAIDHLKACTGDYCSRIWDVIGKDVVRDVLECTGGATSGFTRDDITLAIGRAIARKLNIKT